MSRIRVALTLPLLALLLLAQQGAMLHELSHLYFSGRAVVAQVHPSGGLVDDSRCLTCQAYAQIAHPAPALTADRFVPPAAVLQTPPPAYSAITAAAPTPRSRGPPHIAL